MAINIDFIMLLELQTGRSKYDQCLCSDISFFFFWFFWGVKESKKDKKTVFWNFISGLKKN